jgi:hypothetical protein
MAKQAMPTHGLNRSPAHHEQVRDIAVCVYMRLLLPVPACRSYFLWEREEKGHGDRLV